MIQALNLCKRYGRFAAVNNLNLMVRQGTVFGLVGENGAGKTTTLSMLATLTAPSSGHAYIDGFEISRQSKEVRRSLSYMPDSFGVYDDLSTVEYLQFFADCYNVPKNVAHRRMDDLLERVHLEDHHETYVNALSKGMQQRLEIARCLMHDPQVLILDEPTSGLDPRSRIDIRTVLQSLRDLGKTILISSHILYELSEIADEIGIMRGGELVSIASVSAMLSHSSAHRRLWLAGQGTRQQWEQALREDARVRDVHFLTDGVEVLYAGTLDQQAELMKVLLEHKIVLYQFAERPTDIEALFLRLTDRGVVL